MQSQRSVPGWFWVAWPLVSVASVFTTIGWPAWQAAWLPLLLGGLWLLGRRFDDRGRLAVTAVICGAVASLAFVMFVPTRVPSEAQLSQVQFGWPLSWLTQDLTWMDAPFFPVDHTASSINRSGLPAVSHVAWAVDILVLSVAAAALLLLGRRLDRSSGAEPAPWWFWLAWPAVAVPVASGLAPAWQAALLGLVLPPLWLLGRRLTPTGRTVVNVLIVGATCSLVAAKLVPTTVTSAEALADVRFGWPLRWSTQDLRPYISHGLPVTIRPPYPPISSDVFYLPWLATITGWSALAALVLTAVPPKCQKCQRRRGLSRLHREKTPRGRLGAGNS